ncbi:MAG: LysM peptidoglycan-binding domain-containing M23 family metallopeptidase [Alphaproteobacteria bacterium]|nr:peptidoglycan DD-metalloendopeptidase family protein [Rhizobiaceae bacterium]MBU3962949.1 LysM peptidoglycan-binding domain-containing M23 family metallopeptidase [Alphaproteobacteria bacterium]MBU4049311.1 LysM peptidoglycan-binding domain-containing M23 family metallopeptidase [Alphaproteobacteria bacterium]MBU4087256.1 LysM peptidoglycan-binding domain-containing M23 family metallopeptidase [Alphaproteobacteria bacterium]MBU4154618.1 LysM peptidoglycan-binding domain-containing M23 family
MRMSVSPKTRLPVARLLVAMLLASAATGCSSDASRFSSVFSTDNLTTASIPRRNVVASPVPAADVGGMQSADYANRQQAVNQPYPSQPSYAPASAARAASAPVAVQRAALAAPAGSGSNQSAERAAALAQPFPAAPAQRQTAMLAPPTSGDALTTGSTKSSGTWSKTNAARVTLRPGESISTLSARYGVPEREILKANGLSQPSDAAPGQLVLIPTLGGQANAARAAADASVLPDGSKKPTLPQSPEQNVAVLPTVPTSRDKSQANPSSATGKAVAGAGEGAAPGAYVVKPGDSLNKIAKATGTPIDKLKAANGLTSANIRIGQALKIPASGAVAAVPATDSLKTATIPASNSNASAPAAYKAPVATKSVSEVASADPKETAPEATGIGKYRWPVRGAVVAGYGANVDGKRNDGIDISVPEGTPVKAAENGVVIYAGNGLKELGNTVLVRHDDGTVTVYGHADALSVQRGQKVQRGQQLATSGMSGNVKRPMLHFEVRKDASPVNPMTFLE